MSAPAAPDFLSPLFSVPGLGPRRAAALAESGFETLGDLLRSVPRRYIDRAHIVPLSQISQWLGRECTVCGTVARARLERGRRTRLRILLDDGTGKLEAVWFHGHAYLRDMAEPGQRLLLSGVVGKYAAWQMIHPRAEPLPDNGEIDAVPFVPVYRISSAMKRAKIGQKTIMAAISWCLGHVRFPATLPAHLEQRHGFAPLEECLRGMHNPRTLENLERYQARLRYEQLYTLAVNVRMARRQFARPGTSMSAGPLVPRFESSLPFPLTPGQQSAVRVLLSDAASERRMHRLLQGDVGCGKTVVAFMACLPAIACGRQVAWMAPTEVLARQSFERIRSWLQPLGEHAGILTGASAVDDRRALLKQLADGALKFVVGTHALLQPQVQFARLGMIVVDEQQRFGVTQRLALQQKSPAADFLLMSATPIPQTLAQSIYGDLEIATIDGLPPGRQPVETHLVPEARRAAMEAFVAQQVRDGGQAYWVVPRIDSADEEDDELQDVTGTCERLRAGPFRGMATGLVHGRMDAPEKDDAVGGFAAGRAGLLVATSVVEVGIDAPGATMMVVENAERFGLSQLHQLRGRVGRGSAHAYCFLLSPAAQNDSAVAERLKRFCDTSDGFAIAELDLRLRGPGQALGSGQSGWDDGDMRAILDDLNAFRNIMEELENAPPGLR